MKRVVAATAALFIISLKPLAGEVTDSLPSRQLDEIVVTGSNEAVGRNLLPYTVTTVGSTQLESTGNTQLLSAVSDLVPSLFVTQRNVLGFGVSNGGSGHIKMRGVGGDRAGSVLMMVDGQPQFAGIYSHHVADFYETDYVERVEVLRGPSSVLYGSNAMAGVINVITKNPHKDGVRTSVTSSYGSYNTWQSGISNTVKCGRFSSLASLGYDRTDGVKEDFDFKQTNAYLKVAYELNRQWKVKADYTFMSFKGNDPVYPSLRGQEGVYHQSVIRGESSLTATNSYKSTNGAVRAYYSYGNHFIHDPNYFHSVDDRFGIILYQNFTPWSGASATAGFDFDRYSGRIPVSGGKDYAQNPMATLRQKSIVEYSPYMTLSQSFFNDVLILNGGLRVANSDKFSTQCIPQVGISANVSTWNLKASLSKGYRNPSFRELYLYKFANENLKPENMMNYEVTLGHRFSQYFSFDLTGYYAKGSNLIEQAATQNENRGSFINKGIELSARSYPADNLQLWSTYSYLHSSIKDLTAAPRHQYYLGLAWDANSKFHVDAAMKGVADLFVADDVEFQNYATVDLRVSYQLIRQLQLFVKLDNITDARYTINKGYPMPGFTAFGGFKLNL